MHLLQDSLNKKPNIPNEVKRKSSEIVLEYPSHISIFLKNIDLNPLSN